MMCFVAWQHKSDHHKSEKKMLKEAKKFLKKKLKDEGKLKAVKMVPVAADFKVREAISGSGSILS